MHAEYIQYTNLLDSLGFVIDVEKSMFLSSQTTEYLGSFINSVFTNASLTFVKKQRTVEICGLAVSIKMITIRFLAKILGKLSRSFFAVPLGKLF